MQRGAIILCGGKSSRMGRDKANLPFGPEAMLQRVVRILGQIVSQSAIIVVAAEGQSLPKLPAEVLVARDQHPHRGPLEGLAAGLDSLPNDVEAIYASSCDVPLIQPHFVETMFSKLGKNDVAVAYDGKFHHPLAAVYRPHVLTTIRRLLAENELRPRKLFAEVNTLVVDTAELQGVDPNLSTLLNLNCPEDYQQALQLAGFSIPTTKHPPNM